MLEPKHPTAKFPLAREVTGQEKEDLIASMGGHEAIREGIRYYGERCDLFDSQRDKYQKLGMGGYTEEVLKWFDWPHISPKMRS